MTNTLVYTHYEIVLINKRKENNKKRVGHWQNRPRLWISQKENEPLFSSFLFDIFYSVGITSILVPCWLPLVHNIFCIIPISIFYALSFHLRGVLLYVFHYDKLVTVQNINLLIHAWIILLSNQLAVFVHTCTCIS